MGIPSSSRRKPFSRSGAAPSTPTPPRALPGQAPLTVRPLPLILGDWEQLDMISKVDELMPLLKRFWPGPLSVIFPARLRVPDILTGGTGRVAVRLSSHPVARPPGVGEPITSSSANISGNPAVVSVKQLDEELIASVMGILDEPPVPAGGLPSTLVERMEDGRLRLLRAGAVTSAQIVEAGFEVVEENKDWRKGKRPFCEGLPLPPQTSFPSQDFQLYRILHGGFSVRDKFFLGSSFLKKQKRPGILSRAASFSLLLSAGGRLPRFSFHAALHTVYRYESFGGGMGFGKRAPFSKGLLPNLPLFSSLTMQARPDRSRGTRRCRHQRARRARRRGR